MKGAQWRMATMQLVLQTQQIATRKMVYTQLSEHEKLTHAKCTTIIIYMLLIIIAGCITKLI